MSLGVDADSAWSSPLSVSRGLSSRLSCKTNRRQTESNDGDILTMISVGAIRFGSGLNNRIPGSRIQHLVANLLRLRRGVPQQQGESKNEKNDNHKHGCHSIRLEAGQPDPRFKHPASSGKLASVAAGSTAACENRGAPQNMVKRRI